MILVVAEQRDGKLNRATWETVAGAQQLAGITNAPIAILIPGVGAGDVAHELAAAAVKEIVTLESPAPKRRLVVRKSPMRMRGPSASTISSIWNK